MIKKIMVIDDDKDIREIMLYLLTEEGYEAHGFGDTGAVKKVDELKPDLIILDNYLSDWLSDVSGAQLCKKLKSNPNYQHIKIILTSAVSNIGEIAIANNADGHLKKPFDITDFTTLVSKY